MRVLCAAWGTRGDFQPLLALALGLREAGHEVVLAASPSHAPEAAAFEIDFHEVGIELATYFTDPSRSMAASRIPTRLVRELWGAVRADAAVQVQRLARLAEDADLVVGSGVTLGASSAAEAAGAPYVYAGFSPQLLRSRHNAPILVPVERLPSAVNTVGWLLTQAFARTAVGGPINRSRRALGLGRVADVVDHMFPVSRALLAYDAELGAPAADLALRWKPTGAWQLEDPRPLDPHIEAFAREGAPTVYVGFGSMPDPQPQRTAQMIGDAVRIVGCRAIVASGWARLDGICDEDVLMIGTAPHAKLFPLLAAAVHHGGAGTVATAARAGIPQVIVPHAFDQYGWGLRVRASGIGPPPLPRGKLSPGRLATRIRRAIDDRSIRQKAQMLAGTLAGRNGVATAVGILEREVGRTAERTTKI